MSDPVGIDIQGLDRLLAALAAAPQIVGPALERTTKAALYSLLPDLKQYPPPPLASTYVRTNNLARGWSVEFADYSYQAGATLFEASLTNTLARTPDGGSYGPYVQDADEQVPEHMGRWDTVQAIIERHQDAIQQYYDVLLARLAQELGGRA